MSPITECRVLEACKARRVNTMLIHTSINRMKRAAFHLDGLPIDYRLILEPIIKSFLNLFCRHLNGKMVWPTGFALSKPNDMLVIFCVMRRVSRQYADGYEGYVGAANARNRILWRPKLIN